MRSQTPNVPACHTACACAGQSAGAPAVSWPMRGRQLQSQCRVEWLSMAVRRPSWTRQLRSSPCSMLSSILCMPSGQFKQHWCFYALPDPVWHHVRASLFYSKPHMHTWLHQPPHMRDHACTTAAEWQACTATTLHPRPPAHAHFPPTPAHARMLPSHARTCTRSIRMAADPMALTCMQGWGENDRGVSYTFGPDCVTEFLQKHDLDLVCRAHQVRQWLIKALDSISIM